MKSFSKLFFLLFSLFLILTSLRSVQSVKPASLASKETTITPSSETAGISNETTQISDETTTRTSDKTIGGITDKTKRASDETRAGINDKTTTEISHKTTARTADETTEIRESLGKYYEKNHVKGSFVLYDQKNNKYIVYNQPDITRALIPASTFKICNSLIALETGVVKDEHVTFKWDGKTRQRPEWNADTDMKLAFKNSTVWYYQEIAKRIGEVRMKEWLDKAKYGNADIGGGIDGFWLWGKLRITPMQQIDFLKRLHDNKLPFSQRSMDLVKEIMIAKDNAGYVLRAKTGGGKQDDQYIGWYVGYVTINDNVYYFSNCIQSENGGADFLDTRTAITFDILNELKIIKK